MEKKTNDWFRGLLEGLRQHKEEHSSDSRYDRRETLGEGATAIVYRAWDRHLKREVAQKAIKPAALGSESGPRRFLREAKIAATLSHPNLVRLYDVVEEKGGFSLIMELIEGKPLSHVLEEGKIGARELVGLIEKVCRGLSVAHDKGIVHRDLKPANILVTSDGVPKVGDFGLAMVVGSESRLTITGAVVGTPAYMAPEQLSGSSEEVSPRTDVFALGVILYEGITGILPHTAESVPKIFARILNFDPRPPRRIDPRISSELETVILKALEKEPSRRYQNAEELGGDLHRWLIGDPVRAHPPSALYRLKKSLKRRKALLGLGASSALVLAATLFILLPKWQEEKARASAADRARTLEREEARQREKALKVLGSLWLKLVLAKKDFQNEANDPENIRANIRKTLGSVTQFIQDHPEQPQGYYVRARGWLYLEQLALAERDLIRSLDCDPKFYPGEALLGRVKLEQHLQSLYEEKWSQRKKAGRSTALLTNALKRLDRGWSSGGEKLSIEKWGLAKTDEDTVALKLARALVLGYVRKDKPQAIALLKNAFKLHKSEEYCNWIGVLSEDPEIDILWQTRAIRIMPLSSKAYADRGIARCRKGDYAGGVEDYSHAIKIQPRTAHVYNRRGMAYTQLKKVKQALADFTKSIELNEQSSSAFMNRGAVRKSIGNYAGALTDVNMAIRLDPENGGAYINRGALFYAQGNKKRARADYDQGIKLEPDIAMGYQNRGRLFWDTGDVQAACADYNQWVALRPKSSNAYRSRGACLHALGKYDQALLDYGQAIKWNPKNARAYNGRGLTLQAMKDFPGALSAFRKAIQIDPRFAIGHYNLGIELQRRKEMDEAISSYTKAIDLNPKFADAYFSRGVLLAAKGETKRAMDDYSKAIAANPRYPEPYVNRGILRYDQGDRAAGIQDLESALRVAPQVWIHRKRVELYLKKYRDAP